MKQFKASITARLVLIVFVIIATGPVIADEPSWAGVGGKQETHQQKEAQDKQTHKQKQPNDKQMHKQDDGQGAYKKYHNDRSNFNYSGGKYFIDQQRSVIHDYYAANTGLSVALQA
jgi:hypothetical protein